MNIQINCDLVAPIRTQVVGWIQFDIVSGNLPFDTQLPSIRKPAQELDMALHDRYSGLPIDSLHTLNSSTYTQRCHLLAVKKSIGA